MAALNSDGRQGWQVAARTGRQRIQKLARVALNADVTVGQVDSVLSGSTTRSRVDELAPRLISVVERLETIVDRVERLVGVGEVAGVLLAATETAVRG